MDRQNGKNTLTHITLLNQVRESSPFASLGFICASFFCVNPPEFLKVSTDDRFSCSEEIIFI